MTVQRCQRRTILRPRQRWTNQVRGRVMSGRPEGHANISAMSERVKVHFPIEVEDGWPPVSGESLWAVHVEDEGCTAWRTPPFFVRGAACGDLLGGMRCQ